MNRFIRRNQKKLLAVFGAFLMVVFIIQLAPKGMQSGPVEHTAGTLGGTKISQLQLLAVVDEWRLLKQLRVPAPDGRQETALLDHVIGPQAAAVIDRNPRSFFLLLADAQQQGIVVDNEQLQSVLKNNIANLPADGTEDLDRIVQAVHDCLAVQTLLTRSANVVKITAPMRDVMLARGEQMITLNVVNFPASQYMDKIKPPSDADLRNQFDRYSDKIAGNFGPADPMGFGYKVPNRVKVQFIGIHRDEVRRAAIASKEDRDWYVAAFGEFKANRDVYDAEPVAPSTEPSAHNGANATTAPASTEPAARKLEDLDADFQLHAQIVLNHLYDEQTQTLGGQVLRKISDAMGNAFGNWHDAQAAGGPSSMPSVAGQYTNYSFLVNLAQSIQKDYGVLPVVGNIDQFKSDAELIDVPEIGKTSFYAGGNNSERIPFAVYATAFAQPLMDATLKNSPEGGLGLALWQPSKVVIDPTQSDYYFFRISAADPSHVPPMADVKDKVLADWKLSAAYETASEAAHALLSAARTGGLADAAKSVANKSVITTEPFQPAAILNDTSSLPVIHPLNLKAGSARDLAAATQDLLSAPATSANHPVAVAELPPDAVVSVIELNAATPLWTPQDRSLAEAQLIYDATRQSEGQLWAALCDYGALADRLDFKPDQSFKNSSP
jgi:hypothetical protein